jgi:hypothetical protein
MTARRATEIALGVAMAVSLALIVAATNGQGFAIDELPYYARIATKDGAILHYDSPFDPGYLLAPFNGHLVLGGRFIYESLFATIGAHYTAFVLVNGIAICASAGLLFVFARRRVGDVAALAPCLLILFLGIAREQFLWPFDLHASVALAAALGAILSLERGSRSGDVLACLLLIFSSATIEVGLAFVAGAALLIAFERERWRRAWIVVVPVVLYAIWWAWAQQFHQAESELSNAVHVPKTAFESIAIVLGSLTGTQSVVASFGTEITTLGKVLAVVALVALAVRIYRGGLPRTFWAWLVAAAAYWTLLAVGDRAPQSTRYLLVSAVLVLLIAVECFPRPLSNRVGAILVILALLPLPANVGAMFSDKEENVLRTDIPKSRAEFAMLELAGERVDPAAVISSNPWVTEVGGGLFQAIPAGAYLDSASENGSIAYTLPELRQQSEEVRVIADATLVAALNLQLRSASSPEPGAKCRTTRPVRGVGSVPLRAGITRLRVAEPGAPLIGLRRFARSGPGVPIARLQAGGWGRIELPDDDVDEPWKLVTNASVTTCAISSSAS